MLSQGLSHIIFNASNKEDFERTLIFYKSLGFKSLTDKPEEDTRVAWLKLASTVSIKVILAISAIPQRKPAGDTDWTLEENALAFGINNIDVSFFFSFF